ncbi:50S ribosomal protein L32 [Candidatus Dojkabacteria bacterium]|nr:50S ribosomal protein L32 [Candidatus Dojkabacteria bacterium]
MTPLPKRRISTNRKGRRRAHDKLKKINFVLCPKCNAPKLPHQKCPRCGFYK